MTHIFLSYSRRDTDAMQRVRDTLRAAGLDVWTDERLTPGTPSWRNAIETAIEGAGAVVVLMSPDSKRSEWVERELSYAAACQVQVFPVLVKGDARRSVPFELSNAQWVDVRRDDGPLTRQLIPALRRHLSTRQAPARVPPPTITPPARPPAVMSELAALFRFDPQDVAANRRGKVSGRQRRRLLGWGLFCLAGAVGSLILVAYCLSADIDRDTALFWLVVFGLTALGFLIGAVRTLLPKVRWTVGPMQRVRSLNPLAGARAKIGEVKLPKPTNRQQLKTFCEAHPEAFRVYYVQFSKDVRLFLSVEPSTGDTI